MKRENLKQSLTDTIQNYVMDCIRNTYNEVEMFDVKEGVYIAPSTGSMNNWNHQGCKVVWKDDDFNPYKKSVWRLGDYANDLGDLVANGRHYIEEISKEIYKEIFEETS